MMPRIEDWEVEIVYRGRLSDYRSEIIEECAQKLEWLMDQENIDVSKWPAVLRTLNRKP